MNKTHQKLLDNFDKTQAANMDAHKAKTKAEHEARQLLSAAQRFVPACASGTVLEGFARAIRGLSESNLRQDIIVAERALKELTAVAAESAKVFATAKADLTEVVEKLNGEVIKALSSQHARAVEECTTFLAQFCSSIEAARTLAVQCDLIQGMDFELFHAQTIYDLRGRAEKLFRNGDK